MLKKALYLAAALLLVLLGILVVEYVSFVRAREARVQEQGSATTAALRDQLDGILGRIVAEGERLARELGEGDFSAEEVESLIKESALGIREIQGVTACYEPFAFSPDQRLYCPYYDKGTQDYLFVEESYDYTVGGRTKSAWYTEVRDNGARWVEPYFASAAQDWFVDFGIPFHYGSGPKEGEVRGTITMSFLASGFGNLVHGLSLGKTGYGIITSNGGTFLAHPIHEYIGTTRLEEVREEVRPELAEALEALARGETGSVSFHDPEQDAQALFFHDRIPSSGWGIGLMFFKDDLLDDHRELDHRYIRLALVLSLVFVCLLANYYNKDFLDRTEIRNLSILSSVLLLANIWLVGYLEHAAKRPLAEGESAPIVDLGATQRFIARHHARAEELKTEKLRPVPTGLYLDRMEFMDSYNLNIGGRAWQKVPLDIADEIEIGFTFPQMSPFSEASYIEETSRETIAAKEDEEGFLLVGWDFRVTLLLNANYADYPLDKRHIDIELAPLDRGDHLLLVPDLESYSYTNPSKKSGLNPRIVISGNEIVESYFNFSVETYDTDFGFGNKGLFEEVPLLHYNINLRRTLFNDFVTYLIPIIVSLLMMFILIYACGKTQERQGIIESMAAFFFVLVFSHIDLRKAVVTSDLMYIETYYFVTYLMVVLSTWNLITYSKDKSPIFDYNDNQLFKAAYFPLFLSLVLGVTLWRFY